jgi:hypothetical protein
MKEIKLMSVETLHFMYTLVNPPLNPQLKLVWTHLLTLIRDEYLTNEQIDTFYVKWVYLMDKWLKKSEATESDRNITLNSFYNVLDEIKELAIDNELYEVAHNIKKFKSVNDKR